MDAINQFIDYINRRRFLRLQKPEGFIFDKETGLLWLDSQDLKQRKLSVVEAEKLLLDIEKGSLDKSGISLNLRIPHISEIVKVYNTGNNPFSMTYATIVIADGICKMIGDFQNGNENRYIYGHLFPCSDIFVESYRITHPGFGTEWDVIEFSPQVILNMFLKIGFIPDFKEPSLSSAYMNVLKKRHPEKLSPAVPADNKPYHCDAVILDPGSIIASHDMMAINSSLYRYCDASEQMCNGLINNLCDIMNDTEDSISSINKKISSLMDSLESTDALTDEERGLFDRAQRIFRESSGFQFEDVMESFKKIRNDIIELRADLEEAAKSENAFEELGVIESRPRPGFILLVESMVNNYNRALKKAYFIFDNYERIEYFASFYKRVLEEHLNFRNNQRPAFIEKCQNQLIDTDVAEKWADDIRSFSVLRLEVFVSLIEEYLSSYTAHEDDESYKEICDTLSEHSQIIRDFYNNKRIGIYHKNALCSYGDALDRIETERALYEATKDIRKKLFEMTADSSEKVYLRIAAGRLCDEPLNQLTGLSDSEAGRRISAETFSMIDKLRNDTYDAMRSDAESFAEEQEKRDNEFYSLIFRMKKELS